jgi:Alpha-kinase family
LEENTETENGLEEASDIRNDNTKSGQLYFPPGEVAQAFSHFSYWYSSQKRLVCDLQGVYDTTSNMLLLSDPVIHYYIPFALGRRKKSRVHGQTDRGRKGIEDFLQTHKDICGPLCKFLQKGSKDFSICYDCEGSKANQVPLQR